MGGGSFAALSKFMGTYFYNSSGERMKWSHVHAVKHLVELKEKSGSSPWPVIEGCFKLFAEEKPRQYQSYVIRLDNVKKTRKDPKFASTKDKVTGGYLRYTVDIPQDVMLMIRALYNADELPMNREFFIEFARRFPKYRIAEKV